MTGIIHKVCNRETISYLVFGALTTLVGICVFWLGEYFGFSVAISNTLSHAAGITFAYFTNKIFVFRSRSWMPRVLAKEISTFVAGRIGTFVMETLLLVLMVDVIGLPSFICKLFTSALIVIANYVISKKAVFTKAV